MIKLALKSADEVMRRADAEAFKFEDIRASNPIQVVAFCSVSADEAVREVTESAEKVIASVGATVVTSVEDATAAMTGAMP